MLFYTAAASQSGRFGAMSEVPFLAGIRGTVNFGPNDQV
jgi:hypothetical protein